MRFQKILYNKMFILPFLWRLSSVLIIQTTHVPDEYWQSLEVAHKIAFGYGYLTWEWCSGIRSYLYPFLISVVYSTLKFLNLDLTILLIYLPRILHAFLASYADYKFYIWSGSKFALFNLCINWYWYYCATRTLINSLETCLTTIALSEYPWKDFKQKNVKFLWIVGFICAARPTAAIVWLPLCLYHIFKNKNNLYILLQYASVFLFYILISTCIDVYCYKKFILTPLNFFKINVLSGVSEEYGVMSKYWYLFAGLPVLLGINYYFFVRKIIKVIKNYKKSKISTILLTTASVWTIFIYSLLGHKEFRFILPIMPIIVHLINDEIIYFFQKIIKLSYRTSKIILITLLIFTNLLPGFYFSVLHEQGGLKMSRYLEKELKSNNNLSDTSVVFLTKCHSLPFYSHIHLNVSMRFLTCEPNLNKIKNYTDEEDLFFNDPISWLKLNYLNKTSLPKYIISYDTTATYMQTFLNNYKILFSTVNNHFEGPDYKEIILYKMQ